MQGSVHPRACGERRAVSTRRARSPGSSPRVRGTQGDAAGASRDDRFIPARAGNAGPFLLTRGIPPVHPRACGERCAALRDLGIPIGSSRACGERVMSRRSLSCRCGSSPRVRGTHDPERGQCRADRFIPARAGNAWWGRRPGGGAPVHPRACGERGLATFTGPDSGGSSPRVRGNAVRARASSTGSPVHPRACGERPTDTTRALLAAGSSPRVRGTPDRREGRWRVHRFIPRVRGTRR